MVIWLKWNKNKYSIYHNRYVPMTIQRTIAFPLVPNMTINVNPIVNTMSMIKIRGSSGGAKPRIRYRFVT